MQTGLNISNKSEEITITRITDSKEGKKQPIYLGINYNDVILLIKIELSEKNNIFMHENMIGTC